MLLRDERGRRQRAEHAPRRGEEAGEELEQHEPRGLDRDDEALQHQHDDIADDSTSALVTVLPAAPISATIADDSPAWASANAPTRANDSVLIRICSVRSTSSAIAENAAATLRAVDRAADAERHGARRGDVQRPRRQDAAPAARRRRRRATLRCRTIRAARRASGPRPRSAAGRSSAARRRRRAGRASTVSGSASGSIHSGSITPCRPNTLPNSRPKSVAPMPPAMNRRAIGQRGRSSEAGGRRSPVPGRRRRTCSRTSAARRRHEQRRRIGLVARRACRARG